MSTFCEDCGSRETYQDEERAEYVCRECGSTCLTLKPTQRRSYKPKIETRKPGWNLDRGPIPNKCPECGGVWTEKDDPHRQHVVRMVCSQHDYVQYFEEFPDGSYQSVDCQGILELGRHQFKRFNVHHKYVELCRFCKKPRIVTPQKYLTALGVIRERLTTPERTFTIRELMREEDKPEDDFYEPIRDLGYVYETPADDGMSASAQERFARGQSGAPTGFLQNARTEMRGRYRQINRFQSIQETVKLRGNKIKSLVRRVHEYCIRNNVLVEDIEASLYDVQSCCEYMDRLYLDTSPSKRTGEIEPARLLTDKQLEALIAAASYHYIPELNQGQIVGYPSSIFPNLTRPTLNRWLEEVRLYDV